MSADLPASIDPWQAVARGAAFAGTIPLTALPRLRGLLVQEVMGETAGVDFVLAFERDGARRPAVLGSVQAVLPLECQRCLGVVEHRVAAEIRLLLTPGEAIGEPPEPYEALPVVDDQVAPLDLIEDELLLALPQIPMHPEGTCQAGAGAVTGIAVQVAGLDVAADENGRRNPFAVLAGWKTDTHN
jgi:uncharacterized protein